MRTQRLTNEIIIAAITGFESQKTKIDAQIAELRAMLAGGPAETATTPKAPTGKRKVSAAARRRMALGQKARWAKIRGESEPPTPATQEAPKAKRNLSNAGRANIVAALKKRWAAKKAAAKSRSAAPKKAAVKQASAKRMVAKKAAEAPAKGPGKKAAAKKTVSDSMPISAADGE